MRPLRFDGWIAGLGTASGARVVLARWAASPFGSFSDVMLEDAGGHRLPAAPSRETADFVAGPYDFDGARVVPVGVRVADGRHRAVSAARLDLGFRTDRRGPAGLALRAVPGVIATRPGWIALWDRPARLPRGARTHGSARAGRHQWYGARDLHPLTPADVRYEGVGPGALNPVEPPLRFGSGSTPRSCCVVRVTTSVSVEQDRSRKGAVP